ncbi:MAG: nucleoside recognition domain-containing protein, partial [Chromatiales bacterium]
MNAIFLAIVFVAFAVTAWRQVGWVSPGPDVEAPMQALTSAVIEAAKSSVTLALGLIGVMALFLGLMKVAEAGGLLRVIARLLRPLMVRLFPDVPAEHPAMGAMIMNMSANALGLGNAATPFGIRAMQELDRLNPHKGTSTNAMALFLAVNTSSVTLLPTGIIALRASAGSSDPAGILPTTLFATLCSTTAAIVAAKLYQRWSPIDAGATAGVDDEEKESGSAAAEPLPEEASHAYPAWVSWSSLMVIVALIPLAIVFGAVIGPWIV